MPSMKGDNGWVAGREPSSSDRTLSMIALVSVHWPLSFQRRSDTAAPGRKIECLWRETLTGIKKCAFRA